MTNTAYPLTMLAAYENIARRIGYVDDPGFDGLVFSLDDPSRVAVYIVDDLQRAEVRVAVAVLVGDDVEILSEQSFEASDIEELDAALNRAAQAVS